VGAPGLTVLSDVASGPTALIATGAPVSLNLSKSKESGDKKGLTPVTKVGENTGVDKDWVPDSTFAHTYVASCVVYRSLFSN
jgi:hypothetical protein